jgi:hypothetical protein
MGAAAAHASGPTVNSRLTRLHSCDSRPHVRHDDIRLTRPTNLANQCAALARQDLSSSWTRPRESSMIGIGDSAGRAKTESNHIQHGRPLPLRRASHVSKFACVSTTASGDAANRAQGGRLIQS